MSYKLIEAYNKLIKEAESQYVETSVFAEKPIMTSGIITPDSTISIQPMFGIEFKADKEGMEAVLRLLEERLASHPDGKLLSVLTDVYVAIDKFLGGRGIKTIRQSTYINNKGTLTLSDIQGKNIGQCAERATIAHNCLKVLEKTGAIQSYSSKLTNSFLDVDGNRGPHSFVTLISKDPTKDSLLFDIENLLHYKTEPDGQLTEGVGLYAMMPDELEQFKEGKTLKLKSIWEKFGLKISDKDRYYGNEKVKNIQAYGE